MISGLLPAGVVDEIVDELSLPIVVFNERQLIYANQAALELSARWTREHASDLAVLLRDHLDATSAHLQQTGRSVALITPGNGELFYIHLRRIAVKPRRVTIVASIRQMAPEREAAKRHYRLSVREAQIVDLVLKGQGNRDIAAALGIAEATAKKHLTNIFDKVGVDSRAKLISRLA